MADLYYDYQVDPFNSDTPDYIHVQSTYYSGAFGNRIAPSVANYPPSSATRYFLTLPGIIDTSDLAGARPFLCRDVTNTTTLTRVTGVPGVNEFRISPSTSERRNIIEHHSGQAGSEIGFDFYMIGSMPSVNQYGQETIKVASSDSYSNGNASYIIQTIQDAGVEINALIAELNSNNGGTIFFEEGTYNIATTISLAATNVNLKGQGTGTIFNRNGAITNVINCASGNGCVISDLKIDGKKATYSTGIETGIIINNTQTKILRCNIVDNDRFGIDIQNSSAYSHIEDNIIDGNSSGVVLTGSGDNIIKGNYISNGSQIGIEVDSTLKSIITNNNVTSFINGISLVNNSDLSVISNNILSSNSFAGILTNLNANSTLSNNVCVNNTSWGIQLNSQSYTVVNGNITSVGTGTSIQDNTGTGNIITDNS